MFTISMKKLARVGCLTGIVAFCAFCGYMTVMQAIWVDNCRFVDREHVRNLAVTFAYTLMQNCGEDAKQFVDRSQWDRIDDWVATHEKVACVPLDIPDEWTTSASGYFYPDPDSVHIGSTAEVGLLQIWPPCLGFTYLMSLQDIQMRRVEEGWLIVDWGAVEESFFTE